MSAYQVTDEECEKLQQLLPAAELQYAAQAQTAAVNRERMLARAFLRCTLAQYLSRTTPHQVINGMWCTAQHTTSNVQHSVPGQQLTISSMQRLACCSGGSKCLHQQTNPKVGNVHIGAESAVLHVLGTTWGHVDAHAN